MLKQYDQPSKSNAKQQPSQKSHKPSAGEFSFNNPPPPQQQSKHSVPTLPKYEPETRKANISLFSNAEQRRTFVQKPSAKPSVDQSFDIDTILQGRSIQPQQPPKYSNPMPLAKNSAASSRKDSDASDWLSNDFVAPKSQPPKITTNMMSKPPIALDPDDFFSNHDHNENKAPFSTTKTSAKQYYLGNSRYKPGKQIYSQ